MTKETQILPCPFCGGGDTQIDENRMPPTMNGKSGVISASVRHWCPKREGQPHGLIVNMIGRDRESAIAAWNTRTPAIADSVDPDMPASQIRLHFGELTDDELRLVRAAIRFANSGKAATDEG